MTRTIEHVHYVADFTNGTEGPGHRSFTLFACNREAIRNAIREVETGEEGPYFRLARRGLRAVSAEGYRDECECWRQDEERRAEAAARWEAHRAAERAAIPFRDRIAAALGEADAADEAHAEQNRIEEEDGPNPDGWADVDDARMAAGDECATVLRELAPVVAAWDAFAGLTTDRDCMDYIGRALCCEEADALARVYLGTGRPEHARNLIESHGMSDDDVDDVHRAIYAASDHGSQTDSTIRLAAEYVATLTA